MLRRYLCFLGMLAVMTVSATGSNLDPQGYQVTESPGQTETADPSRVNGRLMADTVTGMGVLVSLLYWKKTARRV
jgi:hypothetical protein